MKKKLLQINVTANWGSTGKIVEAIGKSAVENGWESYIAYGRMGNLSASHLIKVGSKMDNYIHYAYNRLFDKEGRSSVQATKILVKQIIAIKPDIVQLHNIHDHYLNYQILFEYLNQTNIKVVWTFHDCWAFTGHCYHFVQQNCMKWKTECEQCVKRNKFVDRSRENFLLKKSLFTGNKDITIVPCSEWMGNLAKESFLKEKRIQVIHNGVDLNTFKVLPNGRKNDRKFRIIAVSNVWQPYKGINDIFKLREMLSDDYELTVVGLAKKQLKTVPIGIRGITRTQNVQELVKLYNEADVLINPTYADTFPTINLESLACGTPVITYRTGGSHEAIDDKTGIVVERGDIKMLQEAIETICTSNIDYSVNCRQRAEKYFNKDDRFREYIDLFNQLLRQ